MSLVPSQRLQAPRQRVQRGVDGAGLAEAGAPVAGAGGPLGAGQVHKGETGQRRDSGGGGGGGRLGGGGVGRGVERDRDHAVGAGGGGVERGGGLRRVSGPDDAGCQEMPRVRRGFRARGARCAVEKCTRGRDSGAGSPIHHPESSINLSIYLSHLGAHRRAPGDQSHRSLGAAHWGLHQPSDDDAPLFPPQGRGHSKGGRARAGAGEESTGQEGVP